MQGGLAAPLQPSLSGGNAPPGPELFWSAGDAPPNQSLDDFLQGLLAETVDLNAALVPAPLAVSFGLSTDSSVSCLPPRAAAALGTGRGGVGSGPSQPSGRRRGAGQPAAQRTGTDSKERLLSLPPGGAAPPAAAAQAPAAQASAGAQRAGATRGSLPPLLQSPAGGLKLSGDPSGQPPVSFSGLLTDQAAAAAAALAEPPPAAARPADEGEGADGPSGPSQPFGSGGERDQQAPPHLRYDFAQAQQEQDALMASFQQQQAQAQAQAQQAAAAALYAQQQQAYQQQAFQQQAAFQQQQAYQQQQQQQQQAGGGGGGDAAAFYQRQAAAAAAAYQFQNPYGAWSMYGPQYGQQYGQQFGQYGSYPPYGGAGMQFPGVPFPGMPQPGGAPLATAGSLPFPGSAGGGAAAAAGLMPSAGAGLPPLPCATTGAATAVEAVNQSEGGAALAAAGLDDDPCAMKKARLIWTPALHRRFLEAVGRVGGVDKALPKAVMREMAVSGLTRENVASHLQKYRMRLKKEEEGGGGGAMAAAAQSGQHTPRAAAGTPGDAEMDEPGGGAAHGGGGEAPRRARRRAGQPSSVPSELSDGRTAEGGGV